MNTDLENITTLDALAKGLGVSSATIEGLRARGLPPLRVGKHTRVNVRRALEWIDQNRLITNTGAAIDPAKARLRNFKGKKPRDHRQAE